MNYLFLSKAESDPATRYRSLPVIHQLRARGDHVDEIHEPVWWQQMWILIQAGSYDAVFIQRKLFSPVFLRLLRARAAASFFDFDDAIFLKSSGKTSNTRADKFERTLAVADGVFAGNAYLQAHAAEHNGSVYLTPTGVDVNRYAAASHERNPSDPLTLVWIGSRSTSRYLKAELTTLEAIGRSIEQIRLVIVADFSLDASAFEVVPVAWTQAGEVGALTSADIGIAPMSDDPWTRGKCALKVIQYMAAGLPVISSDAGANREVIVNGETGFLASDESAWIDAVSKLASSPQLRQQMGQAARIRAQEHFDIEKIAAVTISRMDQLMRRETD